jgi:hypothetical protein
MLVNVYISFNFLLIVFNDPFFAGFGATKDSSMECKTIVVLDLAFHQSLEDQENPAMIIVFPLVRGNTL